MTPRRLAAALAALAALAGCLGPAPSSPGQRLPRGQAIWAGVPSDVVSAELAFARMAREQGTWTAFRAYSTGDAVWPAPAFSNVQEDLRGTADPAEAIVWGPDQVWVSCDGSFGLSTGPATYPDGRRTRFATIWQRQRDGAYKWVLDQGFDLEAGYEARDMIAGQVAECPSGPPTRTNDAPAVRRGEAWGSGRSNDGSLEWATALAADCSRTFTVHVRRGDVMGEVFRRQAAPPATPQGQPAPTCPA